MKREEDSASDLQQFIQGTGVRVSRNQTTLGIDIYVRACVLVVVCVVTCPINAL
jgi:hypothetical protein